MIASAKPAHSTLQNVKIDAAGVTLEGFLTLPENATGIVLFIHGSGSSRFSPRNQAVARILNEAGLSTLLFDLLTPAESKLDDYTRELRFDIGLLSRRTIAAIDWINEHPHLSRLSIGLFGASTGAAAALNAAQARPNEVECVVSRGGRPDLAAQALPDILTPTLLIVGEEDCEVMELNRWAQARMQQTVCELQPIAGATHLFEEPGTLEAAAESAKQWFLRYLS